MLQSVNLRDYMLPNPVKVRAEDNILDAMQVIIDNKISGVHFFLNILLVHHADSPAIYKRVVNIFRGEYHSSGRSGYTHSVSVIPDSLHYTFQYPSGM